MTEKFQAGDFVSDKDKRINGGVGFTIIEVNEADSTALCGYFEGDGTHKEDWFPFSELQLIRSTDGRFGD